MGAQFAVRTGSSRDVSSKLVSNVVKCAERDEVLKSILS